MSGPVEFFLLIAPLIQPNSRACWHKFGSDRVPCSASALYWVGYGNTFARRRSSTVWWPWSRATKRCRRRPAATTTGRRRPARAAPPPPPPPALPRPPAAPRAVAVARNSTASSSTRYGHCGPSLSSASRPRLVSVFQVPLFSDARCGGRQVFFFTNDAVTGRAHVAAPLP